MHPSDHHTNQMFLSTVHMEKKLIALLLRGCTYNQESDTEEESYYLSTEREKERMEPVTMKVTMK